MPPPTCYRFLPLLALWAITAVGCDRRGYPSGTVGGSVTLDGKPAEGGYVTFSPTAGNQGPVVGSPIAGGRFRCQNVPAGRELVAFLIETGEKMTTIDVVSGGRHEIPTTVSLLAGELDVQSGENHADFPLSAKGKP